MLANEEWSYLPASRLGIAQEMVDDLAEVRRMLLSGDIASDDFNMSFVLNSCGSPSCIIGWATEVRLERQCRIADRKLHDLARHSHWT